MKSLRILGVVLTLMVGLLGRTTPAEAAFSMSVCAAEAACTGYWTQDYYGRPVFIATSKVSCMVWADANTGTACTYFWQAGVGVECTGMDAYGNWVHVVNRC